MWKMAEALNKYSYQVKHSLKKREQLLQHKPKSNFKNKTNKIRPL